MLASSSGRFAIMNRQDLAVDPNPPARPWLWQGLLAPGATTLWTSQWKAGKTTLATILISRMKQGGELAGLPVAPAKVVIVSEEPQSLWDQRCGRLDLDGHVQWICRPFVGPPRLADWRTLMQDLLGLRRQTGVDLVLLDPLAELLPAHAESSAGLMHEAMAPVRQLAHAGLAVLMLHHPRKQHSPDGQAARGTGALCGFADILVEMNWYRKGADNDRRRRLTGFSRWRETPRQLVIELNEEHSDYRAHGNFEDDAFLEPWQQLTLVLDAARTKLTREQILENWPAEIAAPAAITLYKWLDRAVGIGQLRRDGRGSRNDPFRYWLPSLETKWQADAGAQADQQLADMWRDLALQKDGPLPIQRATPTPLLDQIRDSAANGD